METIRIKCDRKGGYVEAIEFDSIGLTFAKSGKAHNVVSRHVLRVLTTMCDHDIGVVIHEPHR